ncbi:tail assembly chaperone [Streptomyces phage Attoomi]|uniref:Tail assembly chaperone n=1 Tax=Streptomyces phage Attoomi TaxID=2059881 RepID=A0A2H5BLK7_9CAUD|nr:tail assembly chaperone [Streptomyces phage Attoomi]AUG87145.1 tail assembly chaperone [Streptomyces phage Attoomi]
MSALSCADLMTEAAAEYTSLPLDTRKGGTVQLRNLLMLPPDGLKTARVLLEAFGESKDTDLEKLVPQLRDLLLVVSDNPKALSVEMADWPLGVYLRVVTAWQEETQAGEAQDSDS